MLLRLLCLLPVFILCTFCGLGQAFEPGFLVKSNGDTLRGEIENGFWNEPPTLIRYRAAATSAAQLFRPRQLQTVSFTGGRYFRYETLPVDHAAETQLQMLSRGYRVNIQTDSILAEVLVDGSATLFRVGTHGSTHFLIRSPGQPVLDLAERSYLRQSGNSGWLVTDGNNYCGQLQLFFRDCPSAARAAQQAPFTAAGLAAVVQAYNQTCSTARSVGLDRIPVAVPRRQVAFQGGVLAGVRYNGIPAEPSNNCLDCVIRPNAGLYAEVLLPGRRTAFYGELSVGTIGNKGRYVTETTFDSQSNPINTYSCYEYRALIGAARLGIRYFFPLPKEQQLLIGFNYEQSTFWNVRKTLSLPIGRSTGPDFLVPRVILLPIVELGWRAKRLTVTTDAYYFAGIAVVRGSVAYRLSRNKDTAR